MGMLNGTIWTNITIYGGNARNNIIQDTVQFFNNFNVSKYILILANAIFLSHNIIHILERK